MGGFAESGRPPAEHRRPLCSSLACRSLRGYLRTLPAPFEPRIFFVCVCAGRLLQFARLVTCSRCRLRIGRWNGRSAALSMSDSRAANKVFEAIWAWTRRRESLVGTLLRCFVLRCCRFRFCFNDLQRKKPLIARYFFLRRPTEVPASVRVTQGFLPVAALADKQSRQVRKVR